MVFLPYHKHPQDVSMDDLDNPDKGISSEEKAKLVRFAFRWQIDTY